MLPHVGAGTLQERARTVVLAQQCHEQVQGFDVGLVTAQGQRLRVGQGFLELGCQFVDSHGVSFRS